MVKLICQQKRTNKVIQILDNQISIYIRRSCKRSILMEMLQVQAIWTISIATSKDPWNIFLHRCFKIRLLQFISQEIWLLIEAMWRVERECWTCQCLKKKVARSLSNIENTPIVRVQRYPWSKVDKVWLNIIGWFINKFKKTKSTLRIPVRIIDLRHKVTSASWIGYQCRRRRIQSIRTEQETTTDIMFCTTDWLHMLSLTEETDQPMQAI